MPFLAAANLQPFFLSRNSFLIFFLSFFSENFYLPKTKIPNLFMNVCRKQLLPFLAAANILPFSHSTMIFFTFFRFFEPFFSSAWFSISYTERFFEAVGIWYYILRFGIGFWVDWAWKQVGLIGFKVRIGVLGMGFVYTIIC